MKNKNIFRISAHLCALGLLCALCVSCEDYTESNFGKPEELHQAEQVNQLRVKLADYDLVVTDSFNIALTDTIDSLNSQTKGTASNELYMMARKKRFFGSLTAEKLLPSIMRQLMGNSQFYAATDGTLVTVSYDQEVETASGDNAYVLATGPLTKSETFLLAPKGEDQVVAGLSTEELFLTGSNKSKPVVTRKNNDAFKQDAVSTSHLFSIESDGDKWLLCNAENNYLYLIEDTEETGFQYIDDLGDLEDDMYVQWEITYDSATYSYDIVNSETRQVIRYDADNDVVVVVPDSVAKDYTPIELYRTGHANDVETNEITFVREKGEWIPKYGYMSQIFKNSGKGTNDADEIFARYGWTIENEGSIGELSYVWQYHSYYGMKASAFMSNKRYDTKSWLISPTFDLSKAKSPALIFSQTQRYAGDTPSKYLQIYTSKTEVDESTNEKTYKWKNVTKLMQGGWPDGTNWNFIHDTIPLDEYAGEKNVTIAFKYMSDQLNAATWEVDSIIVKELK